MDDLCTLTLLNKKTGENLQVTEANGIINIPKGDWKVEGGLPLPPHICLMTPEHPSMLQMPTEDLLAYRLNRYEKSCKKQTS